VPGCPRLNFGVVDVRDVVDLHLRAMTHAAAKGERFLAIAGECISMLELAKVLKSRMGASAKRVPTRQLPDWIVRVVAMFDPAAKLAVGELARLGTLRMRRRGGCWGGCRVRMRRRLWLQLQVWCGLGF
jgi:nucleoside-diphosphate-sugar epimerase